MFSIIVPTFNNIEYLKTLLFSIKKNSKFNHEIIIHVNEGADGTLDYVKENNFKHTFKECYLEIYDYIYAYSYILKLKNIIGSLQQH